MADRSSPWNVRKISSAALMESPRAYAAAEADRVRFIFRRYLELGSIATLAADLPRHGVVSKAWTSRTGREHSSNQISPGALAVILGNPIYRGLIAHRDKTYSGRHDAIVDKDLWQAVQARRIANKAAFKSMPKRMDGPLLLGRIQDDAGNTMRISHTQRRPSISILCLGRTARRPRKTRQPRKNISRGS
ncbi:MAG: recombinase family protein [Caulobacteraceae bacterium]|nr:recombinase family protein [Caulobacteraceae bacterium]